MLPCAFDWLLQPVLLDSTTSSCCCTFSSNFCVAMAEQLCSNPWRNNLVGKINFPAMGVSWVFRERVLETLGNRCRFRMFLLLFPVSVRSPPPLLPSFLWPRNSTKKKSRQKKNSSTSFQGQGHKDDDVQPVHGPARIVEQHPPHCVSVCICVCVCVCVTLTSYMIFLCVHTVIQGGQGYLEVINDWDAYCHANYRYTCDKRLQIHLARDVGD